MSVCLLPVYQPSLRKDKRLGSAVLLLAPACFSAFTTLLRVSSHQKLDGCNKMTCTGCMQYFCWICMGSLSRANPYKHFNDPESPCFNRFVHTGFPRLVVKKLNGACLSECVCVCLCLSMRVCARAHVCCVYMNRPREGVKSFKVGAKIQISAGCLVRYVSSGIQTLVLMVIQQALSTAFLARLQYALIPLCRLVYFLE